DRPAVVHSVRALMLAERQGGGGSGGGGSGGGGSFFYGKIGECHYLNGTERVRFLDRQIYNRQQFAHFDSDVGKFVADTPLGEPQAEYWNSNAELLENLMNEVDRVCRHNYGILESFTVQRSVEPKVRVSALQSGSLPETDRLACYVTGFYPPEIEVKWFLNGREETERVVSTDVMQNGDWTYQVLVVLETVPRRGDSYVCRVEHASLRQPISQAWEPPADAGRSK
uniref:38 kDa phosphoprotein,MHC class II beta chain n=1 Tax=Gallus gallus TaxID=9031 RepID=UPI00215A0CB8|nr:Chain B, kDa phosphoprotein,MHC class II beta chain [synthetic construct]7PDY_D Chain D, kDa phosphoprotein,MHC class II beta chain [synthetic construct]7PDY_F Chain F, kDa phosphoprotein,MHC class II beta chain [synthetic construct]